MQIHLNTSSLADYRLFLQIKALPAFSFSGSIANVPDEYSHLLSLPSCPEIHSEYHLLPGVFDYQEAVTRIAIHKKKYAAFANCGLGKSLIIFEYARHVNRLISPNKRVLIITPLMVVNQMIKEVKKFYHASGQTDLVVEQVRSGMLNEWLGKKGTAVGITNYDALSDKTIQGNLGCLILDECFAPGTLVDCVDSYGKIYRKHIEKVVCGDNIINAAGIDKVISTHKREIRYAINVKVGEGITCSPNHPFFTRRGWISAQDLEPGDSVSLSRTAMRMVQGDFQTEESTAASCKVLRSILLSEMENEQSYTQSESSYSRNSCQDGSRQIEMVAFRRSESQERNGENYCIKSNTRSECESEDIQDIEGHGSRSFRAWWQREAIDCSPEDFIGCSGRVLDTGILHITGRSESRISKLLQARLSESRNLSRYRGGWKLPLFEEKFGQEKGCEIEFIRVEGIEVLEQGDYRLERFRDADGKLCFYDIEAERHPSFSVNGLLVHNSSMLKSDYGKYAQTCIRLGEGLEWKLCCTGTPAPNDRTEFANHAVFLDQYQTINSFLSHYFHNKGKTGQKWELKSYAVDSFYRDLSHWSIFLSNPSVYGWVDNCDNIPPINVHIHDVDLTQEQKDAASEGTGMLFPIHAGGITRRSKMSQIAKGKHKGKSITTNKYTYIKSLVDSWPEESTIIWVLHNAEQDELEKVFPGAASIRGATKYYTREALIDDFQSGKRKLLISKAKILGLGLNLQIATRHVFSSCVDSFESFFQAIKRSNRIGSTRDLNVHIPLSDLEVTMAENVLHKWKRVQEDMEVCERIFKDRLIEQGVI